MPAAVVSGQILCRTRCRLVLSIFNQIRRLSRVSCDAMAHQLKERFSSKCFDGFQKVYSHYSDATNCEMQFAVYLPTECERRPLPVLYFLSGLALDHIDFIEKSGAQKAAAQYSVILVAPDSSPRNTGIPEESAKWNVGTKASYYIDATRRPWSDHYKMHSYVTKELPRIIDANFPTLQDERGIMGFSIGGYGAFLSVLKNPRLFKSLSALAPVCDATRAPHSFEGLEQYLGPRTESDWDQWSAIGMAARYEGPPLRILVDQGSADKYLTAHLFTKDFIAACEKSGISVTYNLRDGFGHNYYFIKSFIQDHVAYHAQFFKRPPQSDGKL